MGEQDVKTMFLQLNSQTLREIIWERYRFFPLISTVSIASISFLALNPKQFDTYIKVILTGYLVLTILAPWIYLGELHRSEQHVLTQFDVGVTSKISRNRKFFSKVIAYLPHVLLSFFSILVILTGLYIWGIKLEFVRS